MKTLHRPKTTGATALLLASVALLACSTVTGSATTGAKSTAGQAQPQAAGNQRIARSGVVSKQPAGYRIVKSGWLPAAADTHIAGSAKCPLVRGVQTEPTDGGAYVASGDTSANISSSYPSGAAWNVSINNNTPNATVFEVYVICSKVNTTYSVQSSAFDDGAGCQCSGTANCPTGTRLLGGGVSTSSSDLNVNTNETSPNNPVSWIAFVNNNGSGDSPSAVFAICAAATPGYAIVQSLRRRSAARSALWSTAFRRLCSVAAKAPAPALSCTT